VDLAGAGRELDIVVRNNTSESLADAAHLDRVGPLLRLFVHGLSVTGAGVQG
jgi:hypothetical protein